MSDLIERLERWGRDEGLQNHFIGSRSARKDCAEAATALAEAQAEIARLKDPRTAARLICDEVLQKSSDEAAEMREAMVKATMGTKVPALTGEVRWSVVNDALRALAALSRPHATKGDEG